MECVNELANAIIVQAVKDYMSLHKGWIHRNRNERKSREAELRGFFLGKWFKVLSDARGGIHFEKGQTGSRKKSDYEETEKTDQAETLQQSEALVRCIMNRAERRAKGIKGKVAVYNLTNDQIQGIKDDAAVDAVLLMLAIPVMVIHDKFGDLMRKEGREERFAEHCLRTLEAVQDGLVTLDELKQVLYEETGMKMDYSR